MITYTDQAVLVDKLHKFFSDVPLVQQAAGMIEDLFTEVEMLRESIDEQGVEIAQYQLTENELRSENDKMENELDRLHDFIDDLTGDLKLYIKKAERL